jgi:hypothetical protein
VSISNTKLAVITTGIFYFEQLIPCFILICYFLFFVYQREQDFSSIILPYRVINPPHLEFTVGTPNAPPPKFPPIYNESRKYPRVTSLHVSTGVLPIPSSHIEYHPESDVWELEHKEHHTKPNGRQLRWCSRNFTNSPKTILNDKSFFMSLQFGGFLLSIFVQFI